jgi:hypothetical protein
MPVKTSLLPPKNERQWSIKDFWAGILDYQTAMQWQLHNIGRSAVLMGKNVSDDIATVSSLYALVFNFTNMHSISHRSDFIVACSSEVNIQEPAFYLTITYPLTFTKIELRRVQVPTAMSDTKSLNTTLLEVMISSKNGRAFICDLSNLTLQMVFNAGWHSMNVGSKGPITWNNSRHAPWW